MTQVVEHLSSKHKAMSQNPSTERDRERKIREKNRLSKPSLKPSLPGFLHLQVTLMSMIFTSSDIPLVPTMVATVVFNHYSVSTPMPGTLCVTHPSTDNTLRHL
jgi:hypothetical protein